MVARKAANDVFGEELLRLQRPVQTRLVEAGPPHLVVVVVMVKTISLLIRVEADVGGRLARKVPTRLVLPWLPPSSRS
jgi:hypothetical protein